MSRRGGIEDDHIPFLIRGMSLHSSWRMRYRLEGRMLFWVVKGIVRCFFAQKKKLLSWTSYPHVHLFTCLSVTWDKWLKPLWIVMKFSTRVLHNSCWASSSFMKISSMTVIFYSWA
jgi:hypothetical protein